MIKNDYLVAKLEQLSGIITKVLSLNESKKFEESREVVGGAYKQLLGLSSELAANLSYSDLIRFIGAYETSEAIKIMILAEILKLDANLSTLEGDSIKGFNTSLKSLSVYIKAVLLDEEACLEKSRGSIDEIISEIQDYEIPYDTKFLMFQYFETIGAFDKAEDSIFELIESDRQNSDIIIKAIDFYKRLLKKPEEVLEEGNLPLDEVKDALSRLEGRISCS